MQAVNEKVREDSMSACCSEFPDDTHPLVLRLLSCFDTCPSRIQYLSLMTYYELVAGLLIACLDYWLKQVL